MADDDKTKTGEGAPTGEGALTLGSLKKFIDERVTELVKSGQKTEDKAHDAAQQHTEDHLSRGTDIADQVQRALARIKDKEAREAKEAGMEKTLADLAAKMETPPVERRRVHGFMGWGE